MKFLKNYLNDIEVILWILKNKNKTLLAGLRVWSEGGKAKVSVAELMEPSIPYLTLS